MKSETLAATLAKVKKFMGIHESITVYDGELSHWIEEAAATMVNTAGIPAALIENDSDGSMDPRAFTCILWYVKANFGNDRTGLSSSRAMYQHKLRELQTEGGGAWDPESGGDEVVDA
jgi:hypothetical protein